ncbi:MAG: Uma2 family endonuclease [Planctomycetaceae bacterium]
MGETELHQGWMIRIQDLLRQRYRNQHVHVGSDLLVYYEEGNPRRFVVPDVFVVLDCDPGLRRTFRIWEERRVPDVVFEVTSRSTRHQDQVFKPQLYGQLGVKELFLYDPSADYLEPPLRGFRLANGTMEPIPEHDETLACRTLGIELSLLDNELILADAATKQPLLTRAEVAEQAEQQALRAEQQALQALDRERRAAYEAQQAAQARIAELEEKLRQLQRESD